MRLRFLPVLIVAALALAPGPATLAADDPPKELWDEFPLEPSATPAQAAPQASPAATPAPAPAEETDGMSSAALAALLAGAAGVGGLAALTATRRMRRHPAAPLANAQPDRRALAAAPKARSRTESDSVTRPHGANGKPQLAESGPDRSEARRRAANRQTQPAKPARQNDARRRRAANERGATNGEKPPSDSRTRPQAPHGQEIPDQDVEDAKRPPATSGQAAGSDEQTPRADAGHPAKTAEQPSSTDGQAARATEPTPNAAKRKAAGAAEHPAEQRPKRSGGRKHPAAGPANGQAAGSEKQSTAPPRPPPNDAATRRAAGGRRASASGRTEKPARKSTPPRKRDARGRFVKASEPAAEPQDLSTQPSEAPATPAADPTRPRKVPATPDRAEATPELASPVPAPAPPPPPARPAVADPDGREACEIKLHNRSIKAHFYAVAHEGGPVLARSPYFKVRRDDGDRAFGAPEALRALVDELTAAGWHQTGAGRAPWDLRFERTRAAQPSGPQRAS